MVNTSNNNIFDSISVSSNPISMKEDSRGNIWVYVKAIYQIMKILVFQL